MKEDFELDEPLVVDDGLIAFHDLVTADDVPSVEVEYLWEEFQSKYPDWTHIIDHGSIQKRPDLVRGHSIVGHGVGILRKDGS